MYRVMAIVLIVVVMIVGCIVWMNPSVLLPEDSEKYVLADTEMGMVSDTTAGYALRVGLHASVYINGMPVQVLADPFTKWFIQAMLCIGVYGRDVTPGFLAPKTWTPWCLGGTEYYEGNPSPWVFVGKCYTSNPLDPSLDSNNKYSVGGFQGTYDPDNHRIVFNAWLTPDKEITANCIGVGLRDKIMFYILFPETTLTPSDTVNITIFMDFPPEMGGVEQCIAKYIFAAPNAQCNIDLGYKGYGRGGGSKYCSQDEAKYGNTKVVVFDSLSGNEKVYGVNRYVYVDADPGGGWFEMSLVFRPPEPVNATEIKWVACQDWCVGEAYCGGYVTFVDYSLGSLLSLSPYNMYVVTVRFETS